MPKNTRKTRKKKASCGVRPAAGGLDQADRLYNEAARNFNAGNVQQAEADCRRALTACASHAATHNLLATLQYRQGRRKRALDHAWQAVSADQTNVNFLSTLAQIQIKLGLLPQAMSTLQAGLEIQPQSADLLALMAMVAHASGRHSQALQICTRALALAPQNAKLLRQTGDILFDLGRPREALQSYEVALAADPQDATLHYACGKVWQGLREYDKAREFLERAVELQPDFVLPLVLLARQDKGVPGDPRIDRLEALRKQDGLNHLDLIHVNFSLGKLYEDSDDHDRAFASYAMGNAERVKIKPIGHTLEIFAQELEIFRSTCDQRFFDERADFGDPTPLPVFILGMPRSGTTLVETILGSHPAMFGAGELTHVPEISAGLLGRVPLEQWPEKITGLTADKVGGAARAYRDHLQTLDPSARRIIDKLPGNFCHLWLISLLFPRATVIHCRRDPLDTCLSCYCTDFEAAHGYSCDLETLGRFYRLYEAFMEHWRSVVPLRIMDVHYEDLVADQEAVSRRLVRFTRLDWDPACLDFHRRKNEQAVRTASNVQVGRKIYASSVGRWERFANHLGPLRDALKIEPELV